MEDFKAGSLRKGNVYLERYAYKDPSIEINSSIDPEIIVVIPAYKESGITQVLDSLHRSYLDSKTLHAKVTVIVILNHPTEDTEGQDSSALSRSQIQQWEASTSSSFELHVCMVSLPRKKAGVGFARKIGMDLAVGIFEKKQFDGIIVNLDADCEVSPNYLEAIYNYFQKHPQCNGASLFFEHPVAPEDSGIIYYELFLRYFINAQRFCNLPFAFQTIGSSMAVKSIAYQKQGGMNVRKAGEDFYFIQKIILLGNYGEINDCTVYPSARESDRVPFGTGRAMLEWNRKGDHSPLTYHPESFMALKEFVDLLPRFFGESGPETAALIPKPVSNYFTEIDAEATIEKLKSNSTSYKIFEKHFFNWFDGFQLMKYLHFTRDKLLPDQTIELCLEWLFKNFIHQPLPKDHYQALIALRSFDRNWNPQ